MNHHEEDYVLAELDMQAGKIDRLEAWIARARFVIPGLIATNPSGHQNDELLKRRLRGCMHTSERVECDCILNARALLSDEA